jgi:hypothetical protein
VSTRLLGTNNNAFVYFSSLGSRSEGDTEYTSSAFHNTSLAVDSWIPDLQVASLPDNPN